MKPKDFELNGVVYQVKSTGEKGCKGCAFENSNEHMIRVTACRICMYRINTIYVEKQQ